MGHLSSENYRDPTHHAWSSFNDITDENKINENSIPGGVVMKHNPGLAVEWTKEEQEILLEKLPRYQSEPNLIRYAKVAMYLPNKTVRDVALRCKWMDKKEIISRRRKEEDKSKNKKEKTTKSKAKSTQLGSLSDVLSQSPMDDDNVISYRDIGGVTGVLLEENERLLNQISSNLENVQIHHNISLFCEAHDIIRKLENELHNVPIMKNMPPLPEKLDEGLLSTILPLAYFSKD